MVDEFEEKERLIRTIKIGKDSSQEPTPKKQLKPKTNEYFEDFEGLATRKLGVDLSIIRKKRR